MDPRYDLVQTAHSLSARERQVVHVEELRPRDLCGWSLVLWFLRMCCGAVVLRGRRRAREVKHDCPLEQAFRQECCPRRQDPAKATVCSRHADEEESVGGWRGAKQPLVHTLGHRSTTPCDLRGAGGLDRSNKLAAVLKERLASARLRREAGNWASKLVVCALAAASTWVRPAHADMPNCCGVTIRTRRRTSPLLIQRLTGRAHMRLMCNAILD
jgi:hypothetical protein